MAEEERREVGTTWREVYLKVTYRRKGELHRNEAKAGEDCSWAGLEVRWKEGGEGTWQVVLDPTEEIVLEEIRLVGSVAGGSEGSWLANGFQSWSLTQELSEKDTLSPARWPLASLGKPYGDQFFYPYSGDTGRFHSHSYTYLRRKNEAVVFWGSLDEERGYTIFDCRSRADMLHAVRDCAGLSIDEEWTAFDVIELAGDIDSVFDRYFDEVGIENRSGKRAAGWTSWYHYFTKINQDIITKNLEAFAVREIPIEFFQIDDGYQPAVGDWLGPSWDFPDGMKAIADKVHKAGYKAGLWLAPFVCEQNSTLYREFPEWLLRDEEGRPVAAGFNPFWGGFFQGHFYALDTENSEFRDYLEQVFHVVLDRWGFDLVKLDFLYAGGLLPRRNKTRGQVMAEGMDFLREVVGEKAILGCGVPLSAAWRRVEYCRVGCDVELTWKEDRRLRWARLRELPSTKNSLLDTIHRRFLNRRAFANDPDVFILRGENQHLTAHQKYTLFLVNVLLGDLLFTSDPIDDYPPTTMRLYLSMFPLPNPEQVVVRHRPHEVYEIAFSIGGRPYVAGVNLGDKSRPFDLARGDYFESPTISFTTGEREIILCPGETKVWMRLPEEKDSWALVGSTSHLIPGGEVESWSGERAEVKIHGHCQQPDLVYLQVPPGEKEVTVNGRSYPIQIELDRSVIAVEVGRGE